MATVTGFTAERMLEIENNSVVSGEVNPEGHLILETHGGDEIDAGSVLGVIPTGSVTMFAGAAAPVGWLLCDGSTISRVTYATLFTAIGTTYGHGDGATTFHLPNLKGRVAVGRDALQTEFDALGDTGGANTHTLTSAEMPVHTHTQNAHTHVQNAHTHVQDSHNHTQNAHNHTAVSSTDGDHIHQPNITASYGFLAYLQGGTVSRSALTASGSRFAFSATTQSDLEYSEATSQDGDHTHTITNTAATATNIATTATNQPTTPTNQNATATNTNTGGGAAHNNLQPYLVMNYMIKT